MSGFTVDVIGLDDVLARFAGVEKGMLDLRQLGAWKAVASEFRKIEAEHFAGEGRHNRWRPLKPVYKAWKDVHYPGKPILQREGDLYESLTREGHTNHVFQESAQEMVIGTKDPKAVHHHRGTKRMPSRKPIDLTDADKERMMKPIEQKLVQLVGNAKLRALRGF